MMKTKILLFALAAVTTFVGCTTPLFDDNPPPNPPPKANRVQILMYDSTPRPIATQLNVIGPNPPARPYKVIALLTCEGRLDQEAVMMTAIYYRARLIGADAVINPNAVTAQSEPILNAADTVQKHVMMNPIGLEANGQRCVFRAYAIVYISARPSRAGEASWG